MDNHEIKYLEKKGADSVELKVLKSQLGKRFKTCQLCDFEGRGMVMSQFFYFKVHCVRLCMKQNQDSRTIGLKKTDYTEPVTDFSWLCPDNTLSCWQKFHLWYEPRDLFSNPGQIIEKDAELFRFGHPKVPSDLFVAKKNAFGEHFSRGRGS
jgi:hypothetical protein